MLGAIIGDIAGSRFEWNNIKSKEFDLLTYRCEPTDDSIMTLAVAKALLESKDDYRVLTDKTIKWMQTLGRKYPHAGYGGNFHKWLLSDSPKPYNSYGNGAAMRGSPCAYVASSMDEAKLLARIVTEVTHNHAEGIKGAEAVTVAIYMALHGSNLLEIQDYINANYYHITFKLDDIRPTYTFDVSCQGSVPQALEAFFESTDYEHRNLKIYVNRNRAKSALFFINPPADLQRVVKNLENTPSAPYALLLSLDLALLQMYNYYVNYVYM